MAALLLSNQMMALTVRLLIKHFLKTVTTSFFTLSENILLIRIVNITSSDITGIDNAVKYSSLCEIPDPSSQMRAALPVVSDIQTPRP